MVAHNTNSPDRTPRSLSSEVEEQLTSALDALVRAKGAGPDGSLTSVLESAAREAREIGLRPEELVLAIKKVEKRVGSTITDEDARLALHTRIVRALLEAYYAR